MLANSNQISKQIERISLEGANITNLANIVPNKQYLLYTGMHYDTRKEIKVIEFLQKFPDLKQLDLSSNKMDDILPAEN